VAGMEEAPEPWARRVELVPLDLVDVIVGPDGPESVVEALARAGCVAVPELTRRRRG